VIRREHFCNRIRDLGFKYKRETDRVYLYKKPGNPSFITIPRSDLLDDDFVRVNLKLCGCSKEDIETFIAQYRLQ